MLSLSSNLRSFMIGVIIALLVAVPPILVLEQTPYDTNLVANNGPLDFTSTLTLSSSLEGRSQSLIRFAVGMYEIKAGAGTSNTGDGISSAIGKPVFMRGSTGVGGGIIPIKEIYNLTQPIGNYSLNVTSYSQLNSYFYKAILSPQDLLPLTAGLQTTFKIDSKFQEISKDDMNSRLKVVFSHDHDVLEISQHYVDGVVIKIFIVNDYVYITYDVLDLLLFEPNSTCICKNNMNQDQRRFFVTQLKNIDLNPYIYAVNEIIGMLTRGVHASIGVE